MRNRLLLALIIAVFFIPTISFSQDISDYLILQDIGPYKISKPEKLFPGEPPIGGPRTYDSHGIIAATGHFPDHPDKTYEVMYLGQTDELPSPTVQVTKHAGSDSDKWLLHEVERDFRNYYGLPGDSYVMRVINSYIIMAAGSGGWTYRWLSGNKIIQIEYTDLQMEKPEPLEVVSAYLAKHPSTLTPITSADLRTDTNKTKWIKDEMERRLWLCDRWFFQLQLQKVELKKALQESVDHMNVFLDYREKYYGIKASDEKQVLWGYLQANNGTAIKNKLTEYKDWWEENKDKPINL